MIRKIKGGEQNAGDCSWGTERVGAAVTWDGKQLSEKTLKMCQQEPSPFYKIIGMRKALADNSYCLKRGNCMFGTGMLRAKLLSCFRH